MTPVVAVCKELQSGRVRHELRFWCDKKFAHAARAIIGAFDQSIPVVIIPAGKLRRYHGMGRWHWLRPSIFWPNAVDALRVLAGFAVSCWRLVWWRPDVIFLKGGYVCLPVGWAARLLHIPYVIHDSDAHPGLTNRLLAPGAQRIATGAPLEYYTYPASKTTYVGIPVGSAFVPRTAAEQRQLKQQLGFAPDRPLVVVTGGGLGAARINDAIMAARQQLLSHTSIYLISGHHQYAALAKVAPTQGYWRLDAFVAEGMAEVLAAADIVVARAGATTLAELAALKKPTIIVPNGRLTAGHQLKNAKVYQDALAALIVTEEELDRVPSALADTIVHVLKADTLRQELGEHFGAFARPDAARQVAAMILGVIEQGSKR